MKLWLRIALGVAGAFALSEIVSGRRVRSPSFQASRYAPGSPEQVGLFEQAAEEAGVPTAWASDPDFITLLKRESGGVVGIPNYTYGGSIRKHPEQWPAIWDDLRRGIITAKSSATGLGQMILGNVQKLYPDGAAGIGDAWNEAVGMLRYVKKRYGTPTKARQFHDANGWY